MELAEERSLLHNSSDCEKASSDLTHPRKRLSMEIAWLPGLGPRRTAEMLSILENSASDLIGLDTLTPIAKTNLLAAGLARIPDSTADEVSDWILELAWAFEIVDPEDLCAVVNEERIVSGLPEVREIAAVEAEIDERRRHCRHVIKSALDKLSPRELVKTVTIAVESATGNGEDHGPALIDDMVTDYEVEVHVFLEKEAGNIEMLVEKLRSAATAKQPDSVLTPMVAQLIQVIKNWDSLAQPIQVSAKSRGLDHDASRKVANLVRNMAVELFNEHDKLDIARQLTDVLGEAFAEVHQVAESTAEDASALADIAEERARSLQEERIRDEKRQREITFELTEGLVFKTRLAISPDGITYNGRTRPLDTITRIRWGGTRHSVNGIPSGTTYHIHFGDPRSISSVQLNNEGLYDKFIDCLWKAVGVRLLVEFLHGLKKGEKFHFGGIEFIDTGVTLIRPHFLAQNELVFCGWNEISIWNAAGSFCIGTRDNRKLSAAFSYQEMNNIHVLEAAIRALFKHGGGRLSGLLEEK
jgi:hypothetical protein